MDTLHEHLRNAGIHPYGSEQLAKHEQRLTRFFEREYAQESARNHTLEAFGITTDRGPTWEHTDDLMLVHYDQPLSFFKTFLDTLYLAYSMALYGGTAEEALRSKRTLEQAQSEKFRIICERAQITGHERILNIGCGFGSFEAYLFEHYPNVEVITITASETQADYIRRQQQNPEHVFYNANLKLIKSDFDRIPDTDLGLEAFDLVISIAVFEQVGNLDAIFKRMAGLLKPGGYIFLHLIVSQPVFPKYFDAKTTPVGAYFPGGRVWPHSTMIQQQSHVELVKGWYINGMNYWRTIDEWHRRFWQHLDQLYESVLDQEGVRFWNNYFSVCKVVLFAPNSGEYFGNGHYLYLKPAA